MGRAVRRSRLRRLAQRAAASTPSRRCEGSANVCERDEALRADEGWNASILPLAVLAVFTQLLLAWLGMAFSVAQQAPDVWCDVEPGVCGTHWTDWGEVLKIGLAVGTIAALLVIILWAAIRGRERMRR
jgi:hypothetical protein